MRRRDNLDKHVFGNLKKNDIPLTYRELRSMQKDADNHVKRNFKEYIRQGSCHNLVWKYIKANQPGRAMSFLKNLPVEKINEILDEAKKSR